MPEDLETPDDEQQPEDNPVIRELRKKAERADTAESRATQLERELAVHKAGLTDLTDKQLKALSATHEGDWEPEALKATATELGFANQPEQPAPKVSPEELAAHDRVAAASTGQPAAPPPELAAAIHAAESPEELRKVLSAAGMLVDDQ